jgi:hypothetical protein
MITQQLANVQKAKPDWRQTTQKILSELKSLRRFWVR